VRSRVSREALVQGEPVVFYEIDSEDRVVAVNADWDEQILAGGGGTRCTSANVLGQPLMQFIVGDATRMFVRAALAAVRLGHEKRSLPYRCDTPAEHRRFEMVISPLPAGHVRIEHVLLSVTSRRFSLAALAQAGHMAGGWRCSQCLSVKRLGQAVWLEPESIQTSLLAADVCPRCAALLGSLGAAASAH
jgi:hypothetical protein